MINTILIEINDMTDIHEYFNDFSLLNYTYKYNNEFINLLNEKDFIKNININININENINENDEKNINENYSNIIITYFNVIDPKKHLFNTFTISSNDEYIYYIIFDENNKNIKYQNDLGCLLIKYNQLVNGKSLLLKFSKLKNIYVNFTIYDLAHFISNNYLVNYINFNNINNIIYKKIGFNYSNLYFNHKYKLIEYNNIKYYLYQDNDSYNIFIRSKPLELFIGIDELNEFKLYPDQYNIFSDFITDDINLINNIIKLSLN